MQKYYHNLLSHLRRSVSLTKANFYLLWLSRYLVFFIRQPPRIPAPPGALCVLSSMIPYFRKPMMCRALLRGTIKSPLSSTSSFNLYLSRPDKLRNPPCSQYLNLKRLLPLALHRTLCSFLWYGVSLGSLLLTILPQLGRPSIVVTWYADYGFMRFRMLWEGFCLRFGPHFSRAIFESLMYWSASYHFPWLR